MEKKELPKELYHYTSLETFFNIIRGKELWFFETSTNYDKNEFSYVEKIIWEIIKEKCNFECKKIEKHTQYPDYSLSLTSEEDSYFHFHKYANENTGVCLCFNIEKFMSSINKLYQIKKGKIIDTVSMFYLNDMDLKELIINEIQYSDLGVALQKAMNKGLAIEEISDLIQNLYSYIYYKFAKITKSDSYKGENEYRFLYCTIAKYANALSNCMNAEGSDIDQKKQEEMIRNISQADKILGLKEEFVCANGKIRRCCKINIAPFINQNIISKIIIGCKCKNTVDEIKAFLDLNNIRIQQVLRSKINID